VSRCRKCSIVVGKPGLTAYSESNSSVAKTLKLFITNDILNEIRHHTNAEGNFQIPYLWKDISLEEHFAFFGLCVVSGILHTGKEPVANLRTTNVVNARPIFRTTVARDQYFQILCVICCDDKTTRNLWRSTDKLAPIRDVFESVISRIQTVNTPNKHIPIDEPLVV
jgi:hypothetical protein